MNLHLPQSIQTENELWQLASAQSQIISPKDSSPIIAVVQDVLLGVHRITKDAIAISNKQFMNIIANTTKFMGDIYNYPFNKEHTENLLKRDMRSGHELLSYIMPKNINMVLNNGLYNPDMEDNDRLNKVVIENGIIKQGLFDKGTYQKKTKGLIHTVFNEYGADATADVFDDTQKLVCNWLVYSGFSVGIGDLMVKPEVQKNMDEELRKMDEEANNLIVKLHYGQIENNSIGLNDNENFEAEMMKVLNKGTNITEKIGLKMINADTDNRLMNMINSGSKGKKPNVKQIIACLGQQDIEGKRVEYGFDDRTLPYFRRFDDSTHARGFISNSFIKGLNPQEFFFHAIAGRNGLIDTACRSIATRTLITLIVNNNPIQIQIGKWIDDLMEKHSDKIINYGPNEFNMELVDIEELGYNVLIPTGDEHGKITFEKLTKITRHDPTEKLFKVKTKSGRIVTAADTETFLVWDEEQKKFIKIQSSLLEVNKHKLPKSLKINIPEELIIKTLNLSDYLPKDEYIYGTEFNIAKQLYLSNIELEHSKASSVRDALLIENNILPKLSVTTGISKFENFNYQSNCIYNYKTKLSEIKHIQDTFPLNYDNGKLFGIYIADGCIDVKAGSIRICNKNKNIQEFVKIWFNSRDIYGKVSKKENQNSESFRFYNQIYAVLFSEMFNSGAKNKTIPEKFLYAPIEFIKGFLSGYLSCDCCFDYTTGIITHTTSENISLNVAFMLNRLGIHTTYSLQTIKREDYHSVRHDLRIPTKYYQKFAENMEIIDEDKAEAFANILEKNSRDNGGKDYCYKQYKEINDVVLDKVISIEEIQSTGEKVYDVTVPSTLNFMIANGLVIIDTSEVGYIQRKLIKAMEDSKINHDLTVRDALGNIVQYLYGEDGINFTKYEAQVVPHIEMTPQQMEDEYLLSHKDEKLLSAIMTKEAVEEFDKIDNKYEKCFDFYQTLLDDKRDLIVNIFRKEYEKNLDYPISLYKIINNAKILFKTNEIKRKSDLQPIYVIEELQKLQDELVLTELNKANRNFGYLLRAYLSPKQVIKKYNFDKKIFDYIVDKIKIQFKKAIAHPSEMVGIVSAQSIGEPITQLTLNSVEYNTELLIKVNGKLQKVKIGEWIDERMAKSELENPENMEYHPNDTKLEYVKDAKYEIMACDENGKVIWDNISAVTKHPVVNEDGSNTLIKVKTHSGREVIATKGKSFLTRQNNKILPKEGKDLIVGDYIPILNTFLPVDNELYEWNIGKYFDKSKHLFMSEVEKVIAFRQEHNIGERCKIDRFKDFKINSDKKIRDKWYQYGLYHNKFTVPYNRGDAFMEAYKNKFIKENNTSNFIFKDNCIYPKSATMQSGHLPEYLKLDNLSGFFIGAYLAEGHSTLTQVLISNLDNDFNNRIEEFCSRYDFKFHYDEVKDKKNKEGKSIGSTKTLRLHSTLLAELFIKLFGKTSDKKNIPVELLEANNDFLKGLIDGYFSGDGTISLHNDIHATSISKQLLLDISNILSKFNIHSKLISNENAQIYNISRGLKARLGYTLSLNTSESYKFSENFKLTLQNKQERLNNIPSNIYSRINIIPEVILDNMKFNNISRTDIYKLLYNKKKYIVIQGKSYKTYKLSENDKDILNSILNEDIQYDKVISIDEVENLNHYVYDLTCDTTKNFSIYNQICQNDTFHQAGIGGSGHQTVRGVPRIKEIFSFSQKIKTPSMYIYLKDEFKTDLQIAEQLKNSIELTYMKQIVKSSKIYYCPESQIKNVEGYDDFMQMFELYEEYKKGDFTELSPWFVSYEFDKKKMFDLQIHMIDIEYALSEKLKENPKFKMLYVLSDENASKLALRLNILPEKIENDNIEGELKLLHAHISDMLIKGVKGIKKVALTKRDFMEYNDETNSFEKAYEWVLQTDGVNMEEILQMNNVDTSRLYCNDINVMNEIFGIEVAKQSFMRELHDCLSSTDVSNKHISLLADIIIAKGTLLSIDRHGINKSDIGPLAKCSFEETSEMLIKAGTFAEYDNMIGVSANMMLGQIPKCGTGDTTILIDEKKLHLLNVKDNNSIVNSQEEDSLLPEVKEELFSMMEIKENQEPLEMEEFI